MKEINAMKYFITDNKKHKNSSEKKNLWEKLTKTLGLKVASYMGQDKGAYVKVFLSFAQFIKDNFQISIGFEINFDALISDIINANSVEDAKKIENTYKSEYYNCLVIIENKLKNNPQYAEELKNELKNDPKYAEELKTISSQQPINKLVKTQRSITDDINPDFDSNTDEIEATRKLVNAKAEEIKRLLNPKHDEEKDLENV